MNQRCLVFLSFLALLGKQDLVNADCCKLASMFDSCAEGYTEEGTNMDTMGSNCCKVDTAGNIKNVNIGSGMPTCGQESGTGDSTGIPDIPDMPDMSDMSDTSSTTSESGGSSSLECNDALYKKFPNCETCIYACGGGDEASCYNGTPGSCSPVCFRRRLMTTCQVPNKPSHSNSIAMNTGIHQDLGHLFSSSRATFQSTLLVLGMILVVGMLL